MEKQPFCWVHIVMSGAQTTVQTGEQQFSAGAEIFQGFTREGWTYVPEAYLGALEKVTRGEEILWFQFPNAIDGIVLAESFVQVKSMLEAVPSVSIIRLAQTPFPEWSITQKQEQETAA